MVQKRKCSDSAAGLKRHVAAARRDCEHNNTAAKNPDAYESWTRFCLTHPDALLAKAAAIATEQAVKQAMPLDNNSILILQILERQAAFGF
jgi:hypothetical protein